MRGGRGDFGDFIGYGSRFQSWVRTTWVEIGKGEETVSYFLPNIQPGDSAENALS